MVVPEKSENVDARKAVLETRLKSIQDRKSNKSYSKRTFLLHLLLSFTLVLVLAFLIGENFTSLLKDKILIIYIITASFIGALLWSLIVPIISNTLNRLQEQSIKGELALIDSEKLQENIEVDFFTKLVKINFKYIDKYYLQTQIQADKSFTISVVSSIVAFLIIISGIFLMYIDEVSSAYIATGTGLLSEFISAVFFYLYNKTIVKMGEYHHKLVLTQNISLALKIAEQLPEQEKVKAQYILIEQLTKDINLHLAFNGHNKV